jgi:hypothetical protein
MKHMRECAKYIRSTREMLKREGRKYSGSAQENREIILEMALMEGDMDKVKHLYHKWFFPYWQSDPNLAGYLIEICSQRYVLTQQESAIGVLM